jgi:hypothetical protein
MKRLALLFLAFALSPLSGCYSDRDVTRYDAEQQYDRQLMRDRDNRDPTAERRY